MLNDYFLNTLILVAVTFVGGHIVKDLPKKRMETFFSKFLIGIYCGLTGILLLIYSMPVNETGTLIDLRAYALMMASYVGGIVPTIISGSFIILYRIISYEIGASSYIGVIQVILFIIIIYSVDKIVRQDWKRWFYKSILSMLAVILTYYIVLRDVDNVSGILLQYALVLIVAGVLEYILLDYVRTSNELYRRYKYDSSKDYLTGMNNTRQFDKIYNQALEKAKQDNESLSCLMIDIDHFKRINDTYGHAIGDLVLKELAKIILKGTKKTDVAARVGGEEFCVLLFNSDKTQALRTALGINKAVREHNFFIGDNKYGKKQYIKITVSVGVSVYPETVSDINELKEMADQALYTAKRNGRNRVCDSRDNCMIG